MMSIRVEPTLSSKKRSIPLGNNDYHARIFKNINMKKQILVIFEKYGIINAKVYYVSLKRPVYGQVLDGDLPVCRKTYVVSVKLS